jgi:hypothetical protein
MTAKSCLQSRLSQSLGYFLNPDVSLLKGIAQLCLDPGLGLDASFGSGSIKKDGSDHRNPLPQIEGRHHPPGKREPILLD